MQEVIENANFTLHLTFRSLFRYLVDHYRKLVPFLVVVHIVTVQLFWLALCVNVVDVVDKRSFSGYLLTLFFWQRLRFDSGLALTE